MSEQQLWVERYPELIMGRLDDYEARLDVPMRLVDMCHFQAEHDDHHIARIEHLRELLT